MIHTTIDAGVPFGNMKFQEPKAKCLSFRCIKSFQTVDAKTSSIKNTHVKRYFHSNPGCSLSDLLSGRWPHIGSDSELGSQWSDFRGFFLPHHVLIFQQILQLS